LCPMMVFVLIVSVATAGLFAWLVMTLSRTTFELRVPRALAGVLHASPFSAIPSEPPSAPEAAESGEADPAVIPDDSVELAVRERLYGSRARRR
jgi:hypothetical protein